LPQFSRANGVSRRIRRYGCRAISACQTGFSAIFQVHYDIEIEKMKLGDALEREVELRGDIGGEAPPL
jgi:hypothetical protein